MNRRNMCCVPICQESHGSHSVLHGFPHPTKSPELFRSWLYAIGGDLLELDNNYINNYRRVCRNHFEEKYLCRNNRLTKDAVPTLQLPGSCDAPHFSFNDRSVQSSGKYLCNLAPSYSATKENCPPNDTVDDMELARDISHRTYSKVLNTRNIDITSDLTKTVEVETPPTKTTMEGETPTKTTMEVEIPTKTIMELETPTTTTMEVETPTKTIMELETPTTTTMEVETPTTTTMEVETPTKATMEVKTPTKATMKLETSTQTTMELETPTKATMKLETSTQTTMELETPTKKTMELETPTETTMELETPTPTFLVPETITRKPKLNPVTKLQKALNVELRKLKRKIYKRDSKILQQKREIESAKKIFSNPNFIKTMDNWTMPAKLFTIMQFRENKKMKKGRRFTTEEKIIALTMLKQSPKGYKFLRKIFILPSKQTVMKLLAECSLTPGINENIFNQLKLKASHMKENHKLCALIFDEMHLNTNICYSERKDTITGFVSDGENVKKQFADHVQAFMIKGVFKNYKQPVAYSFSASATKGIELANQIKTIINQLDKAGFVVVCTICDQGTNNRLAIKTLQEEYRRNCLKNEEEPRDNIFKVNSNEIVPLYDPPHLIKCFRNNLITKDLKYEIDGKKGVAKWQHIEKLYDENPGYKGLRLMPKLTESHVVPNKISKMKVKYATQIFSRTVASNMGYLADKKILPVECKETADLLYYMDNLFDSFNGSNTKNRYSKPLLGPVTPYSQHMEMWKSAKKVVGKFEFVNKTTGKKEYVPTLDGWIKTIEGCIYLIDSLKIKYNITSVWMRHLNQDCIENFFGAIRSHGCRNNDPSPAQFQSAFTTLLINNMSSVHAPGANCEDDNTQLLHSLLPDTDCEAEKIDIDINDLLEINLIPLSEKSDPRKLAPVKYVAGYFIKRAKTNIYKNCPECKVCFECSSDEYIKYREYSKKQWLCSPSESLIKTFSELQDITSHLIPKYIHRPNLGGYIALVATVVINLNYITCVNHKDDLKKFFLKDIIRFFIFNYCKIINKILCGKRRYECYDDVQRLADTYFSKHKKLKTK